MKCAECKDPLDPSAVAYFHGKKVCSYCYRRLTLDQKLSARTIGRKRPTWLDKFLEMRERK